MQGKPLPISYTETRTRVYHNVHCMICGDEKILMFAHDVDEEINFLQPIGGIVLSFAFGYGMYEDSDTLTSLDVVVCGRCAPEFMERNPELKAEVVAART